MDIQSDADSDNIAAHPRDDEVPDGASLLCVESCNKNDVTHDCVLDIQCGYWSVVIGARLTTFVCSTKSCKSCNSVQYSIVLS